MCVSIGVDPLASQKGFWAEILGVVDFYYELSVQISQVQRFRLTDKVCIAAREKNGGLLPLDELIKSLQKMRGASAVEISVADISAAIKSLQVLAGKTAIQHVDVGSKKYIAQIELSTDNTAVLDYTAARGGKTGIEELAREMSWELERARLVVEEMIKKGVCWIDEGVFPLVYYVISQCI
jgi:ESCRT-II complex subunit VPS22